MYFVSVLAAFIASLVAAQMIMMTSHFHGQLTFDGTAGTQKIHLKEVPRIGGIAVAIGMLASGVLLKMHEVGLWWTFVICALPAFLAGFWEDITKGVSVRTRLLATILAGMMFSMTTGYSLHHLNIPYLDSVLAVPVIAVLFTGFAVGGIANAINIIDGCHGLASGTAIVLFATFAAIAWNVGDTPLTLVSMTALFAVGGFFALNFPHGRIFLGDAGAYSIGFMLAALAVALPARHAELSPVIGLLVLIYPVTETLYSVARRLGRGKEAIGQPDRQHLHSLVFRSLKGIVADTTHRNSASAVLLWTLPLVSAVMAGILSEGSTVSVLVATMANVALYLAAYSVILRRAKRRRRTG